MACEAEGVRTPRERHVDRQRATVSNNHGSGGRSDELNGGDGHETDSGPSKATVALPTAAVAILAQLSTDRDKGVRGAWRVGCQRAHKIPKHGRGSSSPRERSNSEKPASSGRVQGNTE